MRRPFQIFLQKINSLKVTQQSLQTLLLGCLLSSQIFRMGFSDGSLGEQSI